jgi:hypothetical protein
MRHFPAKMLSRIVCIPSIKKVGIVKVVVKKKANDPLAVDGVGEGVSLVVV